MESLCSLLGYTEVELLNSDFQTLTHPGDLDTDMRFVEQALAGTIDRYRMELLHKGAALEHEFFTEVNNIPTDNLDSTPPWTEEFLQILTLKRA